MDAQMILAAYKLQEAAKEYKILYEKKYKDMGPVIWVTNQEDGESIFITDSFNCELIKQKLNMF